MLIEVFWGWWSNNRGTPSSSVPFSSSIFRPIAISPRRYSRSRKRETFTVLRRSGPCRRDGLRPSSSNAVWLCRNSLCRLHPESKRVRNKQMISLEANEGFRATRRHLRILTLEQTFPTQTMTLDPTPSKQNPPAASSPSPSSPYPAPSPISPIRTPTSYPPLSPPPPLPFLRYPNPSPYPPVSSSPLQPQRRPNNPLLFP